MTNYFTEIGLETTALFYKCDEVSGTIADSSGNGIDLDYVSNAPIYGGPSLIPSQSEGTITPKNLGGGELTSALNNPASLSGDVAWTMCWWGGNTYRLQDYSDHDFFQFGDYTVKFGERGNYLTIYHGVTKQDDLSASIFSEYMHNKGGIFYCLVHDQPNNLYRLYINGKLFKTSVVYATTPSINDRVVTTGNQGHTMQGLAVLPSILTQARILELFNAGVAGKTITPASGVHLGPVTDYFTVALALDNLEFFWKFDQASGTMADSSGNSFDLDNPTLAPTYGVASIIPSQAETCIKGTCDVSTTNNAYAAAGTDSDWSMFFWMAGGGNPGGTVDILDIHATTFNPYIQIGHANGRALEVTHRYATASMYKANDVANQYLIGNYGNFFCMTRNAATSTVTLYMNGRLLDTTVEASNPAAVSITTAQLQVNGKTIQGLGWTSDILTASEALQLYYAGVAGNISGPPTVGT